MVSIGADIICPSPYNSTSTLPNLVPTGHDGHGECLGVIIIVLPELQL